MNEQETKNKIQEIFENIFPSVKENFDWDKDRNDIENWDSFTHMQLISEIEGAFNTSFEMDEIISINKPSDFLSLLKKKS